MDCPLIGVPTVITKTAFEALLECYLYLSRVVLKLIEVRMFKNPGFEFIQ